MLSPTAAGNQGQNSTMSPLGQGRPFFPVAPKGIVLRVSSLTPRTRDTSGCALLAPLGFLLLGNATLAFAQTSDTPGIPGCCKVASVAKWCSWQPQMCQDGGLRCRFFSWQQPPCAQPSSCRSPQHLLQPSLCLYLPYNPSANPLPSNKALLTQCQRLKYLLYFPSESGLVARTATSVNFEATPGKGSFSISSLPARLVGPSVYKRVYLKRQQ